MDAACCENCAFVRRSSDGWLECRRHAATRSQTASRDDGFPNVAATEWCSEFRHRAAGPELAQPDPLDSVRVRQLSRCFAELAHVDAGAKQDAWMIMRTKQILSDVATIIDLPAAVEALKREQK